MAAEKLTPTVTNSTQQIVDALPTSSMDQQMDMLRGELSKIAEQKSAQLAAQKEAAKEPITRNTFENAFNTAAAAPDYATYMSSPSPLTPEERTDIYARVQINKSDAANKQREGRLFSDAEINESTAKYAANVLAGGIGRAGDVAGNMLNVGAGVVQAVRSGGLDSEDYSTAKSIATKKDIYADSRDALRTEKDPEKASILRARMELNSPVNYTDVEKASLQETEFTSQGFGGQKLTETVPSKNERINMLMKGDVLQANIDKYAGSLTDIINQSDIETMLRSAKGDYARESMKFSDAAANFEEGKPFNALGDIASAVANLTVEGGANIIDNPAAVVQLMVQSAPDIITAGKAMPAALAGNFVEKQTEAKALYVQTHGEQPTGNDLMKLNAGALVAGLLDTYGDKFVGKGGGDLTKLAKSIGLTSGVKVIDTATKAVTKVTQATTTGAAGEFIAEGGGQAVTQLAGKQDLSKVDVGEAYAEGVLGAGAGGGMATISKALSGASEAAIPVAQKMQQRAKAKQSGSIKDLVSDIGSMDVAGATAVMKSITTDPATTPEQKAEAIRDLETAFDQRAFVEVFVGQAEIAQADEGFSEARQKGIDRGKEILAEMDRAAESLKVVKDNFRGQSVEAAYQTLTQPADTTEVTPEVARQSAATIDESINTPYSNISTDMAREILDKRAEILNPSQLANLRSYVTTNEAFDSLEDTLDENRVRSNIISGGDGNIGARTYVNAVISSIKAGDEASAVKITGDLTKFAERHAAKAAAMKQITDSFDAGTPMPAAQQSALMAPFDTKGKKFQPFKNAVPKYARMIQEEAQMLGIVSNEMNQRVATLARSSETTEKRVDAEVPGTGTEAETSAEVVDTSTAQGAVIPDPAVQSTSRPTIPAGTAPRGGADAQPDALSDLLALSDDEAVARRNPAGKRLSDEDRVILEEGDIDLPQESTIVTRFNDKSGAAVEVVSDPEGNMYAVREGSVVGLMGPGEDGETVLDVVKSAEGQGIGTALSAEYIRANPTSVSGGFTEGGEATYRAALRKLRAEASASDTSGGTPEGSQPGDTVINQPTQPLGDIATTTVTEPALLKDLIGGEEVNAVTKFVRIRDTSEVGNPLLSDPQFISKLRTEGITYEALKPYLPESVTSISEAQVNLLTKFLEFNEAFVASFNETFEPTPTEFAYRDAINYFADESGQIKPAVLDAMSLSMFNWAIIKSNDSLIKQNEDLGTLIGLDAKGYKFSNYSWSTLGQSGLPFNEESVTIGQEIINNLGLRATQDAPHTLMGRIAASLGGHAVLATVETTEPNGEPLIKIVNVTAEQRNISDLIENQQMSEDDAKAMVKTKGYSKKYSQPLRTIQVSHVTENGGFRKPIPFVQQNMIEPAKGTGSFLPKLFSGLTPVAAPSFTPVSSKDASQVMKRTDRKLSKFAKETHDKFNAVKTYLKPNMVKAFNLFSPEELANMFGFQNDVELTKHKDEVESWKSKNNLIRSSVDGVFTFLDMYATETGSADFSAPFYLDHETTSVNRAQLTQRIMNPQADKTARHMMYRESWKTELDLNNLDHIGKFTLAVGQALGVSLDKNLDTKSLNQTLEILNKPIISAGIDAGVAVLNDVATAQQINDFRAAVEFAGKSAAAMDGLMAYAAYVDAINKGQDTFTTDIAVEYDGVTNGPMITLIQFGLTGQAWAAELARGGIYLNSNLENVPDAKAQGIADVYERVTIRMADIFSRTTSIPLSNKKDSAAIKITPEMRTALNTIFGELTKVDEANQSIKVTKEGRTIAKSVVTPKTYQAGDYATRRKLGADAINIIRDSLVELANTANDPTVPAEKVLEVKARAKALYAALQELAPGLINVPVVNGRKDYLNATIGETTVYAYQSTDAKRPIKMAFPEMVSATYGAMFTQAVNEQNTLIAGTTANAVTVSNMAVMAYEVARTLLIDEAKSAKLAATQGLKSLERELTNAEVKEVESKLEKIFPEVHTALSKKTGEGISLVTKGKDLKATDFVTELKRASGSSPSYNLDGSTEAAPAASYINNPAVMIEAPGVTGVVNNILATDGTIALYGMDADPTILNLYDAFMSNILGADNNASTWNKSFFKVSAHHSVPNEIANMALRSINGLINLVGADYEFSDAQLDKYSIKSEGPMTLADVLNTATNFQKEANHQTESRKRQLAESKVVINQYYAEGAAVTYINGTEVDATTLTDSELTNEFVASTQDTAEAVTTNTRPINDIDLDDSLHAKEMGNSVSTPSADNDLDGSPELTEELNKNNGVLTLQQAMDFIKTLNKSSPTINAVTAIADAIVKRTGTDLKIVRYDSSVKYAGDLAWLNTNADVIQYANRSRGMFAGSDITGNVPTILLMAETMPFNGVNPETLMHEVVHHLFDEKVFANAASPVGTELQSLVRTVKANLESVIHNDPESKQFVDSFGGPSRLPALSNMREFVAWGLSSASFQRILSQVAYTSVKELDNKLNIKPRTVMAKLRDLVQKVIFNRDIKATTNVPIDNALKGLFTVALKTQAGTVGRATPGIARMSAPLNKLYNVTKLNSQGIFNSLRDTGFVKASAAQEVFLDNMLNTVVNVVLNPLQVNVIATATSESTNELTANDKLQVFVADNAGLQLSNVPPSYGFNKSAQEVYVHGLYLNILENGLQEGSPHLNAANDFFNKAKSALTYKDFMIDPTVVDPAVVKEAQDRYDSVFTVNNKSIQVITDQSSGLSHVKEKSDYLRNFLALAATNEQFRVALNRIPATVTAQPATLFERIVNLLTDIIDWVSNRVTGVNNSVSTTANIDMLTKRLVGVELAAQSELERAFNNTVDYASTALGGALDVFKKGLFKLGSLPALQQSRFSGIRLASGIARITGNNKTQYLFEVAGEMFNRLNKGKQTFGGALISEVKGTVKDNATVHSLLRVANFVLDRSRKAVIETMGSTLKKQFKGKLTKEESTAITKAILRTDMSALIDHGYSLNNMADLLTDSKYLAAEIQSFEDRITAAVPSNIANFYINQADDLGFTMVKGFSSNAGSIPNAYGIARLWNTQQGQPADSVIAQVEPLIDALASLQAIKWMSKTGTRAFTAANIIRREVTRTDGENGPTNNGMVFVLKQHQELKAKALADNFNGNGALMRKGYIPDITNPYIDVQPAPVADRDEMVQRGYKEMRLLEKDVTDPIPGAMALYIGDGAGLVGYMRGALSTTGKRAKGTRVFNYGDVAVMNAQKYSNIQALFNGRVTPSDASGGVHMQALYNEDGQVVDYRYMMAEATKDTVLSRNDDFADVLGSLAGSVYDKAVTKPHNEQIIDALKEQYDTDIANNKDDLYIRVSARSTDAELKDMYNILPYETREYAKQVFGSDSIPIRAEFLPVIFGYRKISIGNLWKDGGIDNNVFQQSVKGMFDSLFGAAGLQRASQFERVMQDVVRVAKSNVVVRMGEVTLMNLLSNTYQLAINGLPLRQAIVDQITGYKKGIEYVKQGSRIAELDLLLQADHNPADRTSMINERAQLKHLQAINPVGELIQAGLLQTIVMDVNQDTDPFSYSSILANKLEGKAESLPQGVTDAAKFVFMTKDSPSYEFMNKITQFSDFAARYALYKHLTTRANNPLDNSSAVQTIIEEFVNYDLPTHRAIQYGNDMGFIWFSRYWLRSQKIIMKNFAENPARVLLGLSVQGVLGTDIPDNTDTSILQTGPLHPLRGFGGIWSGLTANPVIPSL